MKRLCVLFFLLLLVLSVLGSSVGTGWKRREVNWKMKGGSRIKAIRYPEEKKPPLLEESHITSVRAVKKTLPMHALSRMEELEGEYRQVPITVNAVNSPPVAGRVPLVTMTMTDAHGNLYDTDAVPADGITGNFIPSNPAGDYAIGILDTGASATLISYDDAVITDLYSSGMVTSSPQILQGVSGSTVTAYASFPLGVFVDGLSSVDPNGDLDTSGMMGETNVSIIVGDIIGSPYVPTAIGAPVAFYHEIAFCNNKLISVELDGEDVNSPYIDFYGLDDPCAISYENKIYLNLLPEGELIGVQYFPCIEGLFECPDGDGSPLYSSIIVDAWWNYQGLYFFDSVDLTEGGTSAIDKDAFMYDTGAQVSVISEAIAARLGLDINNPEFTVEILDVTGDVSIQPGFYVDTIEIVSSPEWLSYNNVPVIVLDIEFPGVGVMDGILGTNLFVNLNYAFRGGGIVGMGSPYLTYEGVCDLPGDIAGDCYECLVDYLDLSAFVNAWLSNSTGPSDNWNFQADLWPASEPDGVVDFHDFAVLAQHWLESVD